MVVVGGFRESKVLDDVQEGVLVHEIGLVFVHLVFNDGNVVVNRCLYVYR